MENENANAAPVADMGPIHPAFLIEPLNPADFLLPGAPSAAPASASASASASSAGPSPDLSAPAPAPAPVVPAAGDAVAAAAPQPQPQPQQPAGPTLESCLRIPEFWEVDRSDWPAAAKALAELPPQRSVEKRKAAFKGKPPLSPAPSVAVVVVSLAGVLLRRLISAA
ncbi:hypothetical protein O1611_g2217 [Lasiodiplodia mahajangana]|uniref:Uncharacterized protein n=1 Tax=Lasiodiplodia mahajangana TaxID=1108764 RepID=A0ACC2JVW1_9PEZI|nr:hypothetical protein O1611_g2217 [Lasiodiplodia mahajangana]